MLKITQYSPDPNPMDYHIRETMLEHYQRYTSKLAKFAELKTDLLTIWNNLPQELIDKAIMSFSNGLQLCIVAADGYF